MPLNQFYSSYLAERRRRLQDLSGVPGYAAQAKALSRGMGPFGIPGASIGSSMGSVIHTGAEAFAQLGRALTLSQARFGDTAAPGLADLTNTVRNSLTGDQLASSLFRETPMGGLLGLGGAPGESRTWLPTQWGSYLVTPGRERITEQGIREAAISLKVAGQIMTRQGPAQVQQVLAGAFMEQTRGRLVSRRQARQAVMQSLRSDVVAPALQAATGLPLDYLFARRVYVPGIREALQARHTGVLEGGILPNPQAIMAPVLEQLRNADRLGLSAVFTKPETVLSGNFMQSAVGTGLSGVERIAGFSPFAAFAPAGRMLGQTLAFAPIVRGQARAFEQATFGTALPRLMTPELGAMRHQFGRGLNQEVMSRIAVIDPGSALGRHLMQGAQGTEVAFLSNRLRGMQFLEAGGGVQNATQAAADYAARHGVSFTKARQVVGNFTTSKSPASLVSQMSRTEYGTALSIMGQKFNVAGFMREGIADKLQADVVIVADMLKDPMRYLEYSLGHTIAEAHRLDKLHGGARLKSLRGMMAKQFGDLDLQNSLALLAPNPNNFKGRSVGEVSQSIKRMANAVGVAMPFAHEAIDFAHGVTGGAFRVTGPLRFRGTTQASYTAMKFDPLNFMTFSAIGPRSREMANRLMGYAVAAGKPRSRSLLNFLNPFMGRAIDLSGTFEVTSPFGGRSTVRGIRPRAASALPSGLARRLQGIRTASDVAELISDPLYKNVLSQPLALRLPGNIRYPTFELYEHFKNTARNVGDVVGDRLKGMGLPKTITEAISGFAGRLGQVSGGGIGEHMGGIWESKLRRAGVPSRFVALPGLTGFRDMLLETIGGASELDDDAMRLALESSEDVFLPKFVQQYGKVLEHAQAFESGYGTEAGLAARGRLERSVAGMLTTLTEHSKKGGLLSRLLTPSLRTASRGGLGTGGVYATIQTGGMGVKGLSGQFGGLPGVGVREVGVSPTMARKLGLSRTLVDKLRRTGEGAVVGGQFYPAIVPETAGLFKLRVFDAMDKDAQNVIVTNVADRLAAFRDLDWDKMRLYVLPEPMRRTKKHRRQLDAAWQEGRNRIRRLHKAAKNANLEEHITLANVAKRAGKLGEFAGMTEKEVYKAFGPKRLTPFYHDITRLYQTGVYELFGQAAQESAITADAMRTLGVSYQAMGIQKGLGTERRDIFRTLYGIGPDSKASLQSSIARIEQDIMSLDDALYSGVAGYRTNIQGKATARTTQVATQLAQVAQHMAGLNNTQKTPLRRLFSKASGQTESGLLEMAHLGGMTAAGEAGAPMGPVNKFIARMLPFGEQRYNTYNLFSAAGAEDVAQAAINKNMLEQGADAAMQGGLWNRAEKFWTNTPKWGQVAIGAVGALLGLRIAKSLLFGDEPMGPAMRMSPEIAARMQMGDTFSGAPLPPTPMMGPGIHDTAMARPQVPFSPPPARVTPALAKGPSMAIEAEHGFGDDVRSIGANFQSALSTTVGPMSVGITSSDSYGHSQRLTRLNAERDRQQSRFYT